MVGAVFLDRDGTLNKKAPEGKYIRTWKEFEFLPYTFESLRLLNKTSYKIIVVTNQRGIALRKIRKKNLEYLHRRMVERIEKNGGRIDKIYVCPHDNGECRCRKPLAGLLDLAKEEFGIKLEESWVIGDRPSDIYMGLSRNCKTIYLGEDNLVDCYFKVNNLKEAVDIILKEK